jgi:hypothetical protein
VTEWQNDRVAEKKTKAAEFGLSLCNFGTLEL